MLSFKRIQFACSRSEVRAPVPRGEFWADAQEEEELARGEVRGEDSQADYGGSSSSSDSETTNVSERPNIGPHPRELSCQPPSSSSARGYQPACLSPAAPCV